MPTTYEPFFCWTRRIKIRFQGGPMASLAAPQAPNPKRGQMWTNGMTIGSLCKMGWWWWWCLMTQLNLPFYHFCGGTIPNTDSGINLSWFRSLCSSFIRNSKTLTIQHIKMFCQCNYFGHGEEMPLIKMKSLTWAVSVFVFFQVVDCWVWLRCPGFIFIPTPPLLFSHILQLNYKT